MNMLASITFYINIIRASGKVAFKDGRNWIMLLTDMRNKNFHNWFHCHKNEKLQKNNVLNIKNASERLKNAKQQ